ncbi:MAG: hypothetical protein COB09_18495 [Thalassobium sp.]|nr:MAG: hypothetical protein COB09_18495 [Thalassobium sp.]
MGFLSGNSASFGAALTVITDEIAAETTWSILEDVVEGTGSRITMQKATTLETVTFISAINNLFLTEETNALNASSGFGIRGGMGYDNLGASWTARQTDGPTGNANDPWACALFHGAVDQTVNYKIFTSEERVWVSVRIGGVYQHLTFGFLEKVGTWVGGFYFGASTSGETVKAGINATASNAHGLGHHVQTITHDLTTGLESPANFFVNCEQPGDADNWQGFAKGGHTQSITHIGAFDYPLINRAMEYNPNLATGNVFLLQPQWLWYEEGSVQGYRHIGNMQKTYVVSLFSLTAEAEIIIGGDTYVVFPFIKKSTSTDIAKRDDVTTTSAFYPEDSQFDSGHYGYAVLKEV